jgi:UPF0716 family protein affecting phage T7 exclusion
MNRDHWLDDQGNVKTLWRRFLLILALLVAIGAFVDLHPHFEIESWFGFYAAYGFITCLLMIVAAKVLGAFLKRQDAYYDKDTRDD